MMDKKNDQVLETKEVDAGTMNLPQSILQKNEFSNPYILSTKAKISDMVEKEQEKQAVNTEENDESPPKADYEEPDGNFDFLAKVDDS